MSNFDIMNILSIFKKKKEVKPYERKLPLIHVDTFPSGEKIYTYRTEDLHHISFRHYQAISEINAYLSAFGQLPYEWKIALKESKDEVFRGLSNPKKAHEALHEIGKRIDHFETLTQGLRDTNTELEDEMLCMFYVLENENELGHDRIMNEKKKELFRQNPSMRAFFLSNLPKTSEFFKIISRQDIAETLTKMMAVKNMIAHSISLKTKM